ncbi:MAG: O-succinylhomoserine sulfhydrylase [Candidatus Eutrophobiaceae bacterium]
MAPKKSTCLPKSSKLNQQTLAVRAGRHMTEEQEHSEPLFLTSSFVFKNSAEAAARFSGKQPGNIYSRFTNPSVRSFEQRLAAMEGGERCIATSSGMGAILATCLSLLKSGDHIVSSRSIFGTTVGLFNNILGKLGIGVTWVNLTNMAAWEKAIKPVTRMLFLETPSNPLTEIADIAKLAALARRHNIWLTVDNCFCTPTLQLPLELGADLVIHSATKYLDGQGRCVGGAIVGSKDLLEEHVLPFMRMAGLSMSPFNAWVFLKGLETLKIRMDAHCAQAQRVAEFLQGHKQVKRVHYPGLPTHPQHRLAGRQQQGFGGIVSFEVKGGRRTAWRVIDQTRLFSITANLGDTRSIITHPASTTHHRLTPTERKLAGVCEGLVRLSVGLEDGNDLIADLEHALKKA